MSHNLAQCQTLVRKAVIAGAKVGSIALYQWPVSRSLVLGINPVPHTEERHLGPLPP